MEKVTVISPTIQKFLGVNYYLCDKYYQKNGVRLHRKVWEHFNGEIPMGYHVHHKDHDRSNNAIENLELLSASEHLSHHMSEREPIPPSAEALRLAAEWHKSPEGRAWHKEQALSSPKMIARTKECTEKMSCEQCGDQYFVPELHSHKSRFCSNKCKTAWRRESGIDDIDRTCPVCDTKFRTNKYNGKITCSKACSSALSKAKRQVNQNIG